MENIKTISIDETGMPIIGRYNGSWHPIEHTSSDGKDYSITIWETYYATVEDMMDNYEIDEDDWSDEDEERAWEFTLEMFQELGVELVK